MLDMFRKAKKAYLVLITVMLFLPMQQSFADTLSKTIFLFEINTTTASYSNSDNMTPEHCNTMIDMVYSSFESALQDNNCCEENTCDSNHCSYSSAFIALLPSLGAVKFFDNQRYTLSADQRELNVLPTGLFRPPKQIQI